MKYSIFIFSALFISPALGQTNLLSSKAQQLNLTLKEKRYLDPRKINQIIKKELNRSGPAIKPVCEEEKSSYLPVHLKPQTLGEAQDKKRKEAQINFPHVKWK